MAKVEDHIREFDIPDEQMHAARERTRAVIDAYALKEARKASHLTQVQLARDMGVSQNRISRMEHGDLDAMSVNSIRRYIEAIGGHLSMVAVLPTGSVKLL